jgi:hypothetical protein
MTLSLLIAAALGVFLVSCSASVLAIWWTLIPQPGRYKAALVSSVLALAVGYFGAAHVNLHASRSVNGHVEWSLNSHWFFVTALILGGIALVLTLWKWWQANAAATKLRGGLCTESLSESRAVTNSGFTKEPPSAS